MFCVINIKKIIKPLTLILLFLALAEIIALRVQAGGEATEVFAQDSRNIPTLIIDAGHGGLDGGAVSPDGMPESEVNLAIAKRMECLAKLFGVQSVMTRESADLDYPPELDTTASKKTWDQKTRAALINSVAGGVLISIHQNKFPDPRPSGTQALYSASEGSMELAEHIHKELISCLCPENRRVAAPISDSIFLMREAKCPAVLVECGFLSNAGEAALLATDSYRLKLATVIFSSFLSFYT